MRNALALFEEGFSNAVSRVLVFIGDSVPDYLGWLLALLLLAGAGSLTLVYLILKLFIPRKYHP